jgi:hypothetical protein
VRARILAIAGCCVVALSSCGGAEDPPSEADEIRAIFEQYQQVVAGEDAETFCTEMLAPSELAGTSTARCTEAIGKRIGSEDFQQLAEIELGTVRVDGDTARAENATTGGYFDFIQEDGRWFLDYFD